MSCYLSDRATWWILNEIRHYWFVADILRCSRRFISRQETPLALISVWCRQRSGKVVFFSLYINWRWFKMAKRRCILPVVWDSQRENRELFTLAQCWGRQFAFVRQKEVNSFFCFGYFLCLRIGIHLYLLYNSSRDFRSVCIPVENSG